MIPVVSVVGKSNSGKTTLLEKLICDLHRRGYKVATIKHDVHGFEIDREGKDTWRHKKAGAHTVVISSSEKIAVVEDVDHEQSVEDLRRRWIHDADIILTEGYKRQCYPKIEVNLFHDPPEFLCTPEDNLVAVVTRAAVKSCVPVFSDAEIEDLGNLLVDRYLKVKHIPRLEIWNNDTPVALDAGKERAILESMNDLLSSVVGVSPGNSLDVRIRGLHDERE